MRLRLKRISLDGSILRHMLRIGLPSAVQQTLIALGIMALARIVNGFGADAIAAYTAAGRLDAFAIMPAMNFAMAISVFVGQNVAAQQPGRVREGYRATLLLSGAFSVGVSIAMVLFRHELIGLFNSDPAVVHIGSRYLLIVSSAYVVLSTMFVTNGLFRGAGDAIAPMAITLVSLWVIRIPVSILLSGPLGTDGIWLGAPVAWCLGLAMSIGYYRTGRWRSKGVVRPGTGTPRREAV
jgi:putative MATE family efflux protein